MATTDPFDRLGLELEAAGARRIAGATASGRPRVRGRRALVVVLALLSICAAAAWAASALLQTGKPISFARGAPIAGRALGAPIPGTVKLLTTTVADPDGGAPWGLRYWETDRKYGCLQVGRVYQGKLGQVTHGKVFHELPLGIPQLALAGCYALDGSGHAFVAIHAGARAGGQQTTCPLGFVVAGRIKNTTGATTRCDRPQRTVDFGLLGTNATRLTYRAGGADHTTAPLGDVGGYLVVQRTVKPVIRTFGFHHRNPALDVRGPAEASIAVTPASQVIKEVRYRDGTCRTHVTTYLYGSCYRLAGFVAIPQPTVGDVRSPIRAFPAPRRRGIRVRFLARQAVVDGRSAYDIEVRPAHARGFVTQSYSRNVRNGAMVRITVDLYNREPGPYRIVVRYRTVKPRPGPYASLPYPGKLVGEAHVDVP
jgi:hypothetical protein